MELLKNLEGLSADEQMTAVVELQKAAMKHLDEQKQASIGKSAELVIQGLKKIKSDFEAKFDSLNYDIQTKVASLKDGEQGLQGPKGDQGERGLDGANGRDGRDGKDGKDGVDGVDGVGVRDAKIDFDGSLVISLTDGREINCGEVVSVDVAKQIQKVTHNIQTGAGGDSQTVLDAIAAIQATIATYGTMATQNANNVAITGGAINNTTIGATTPSTGVFTTLTANTTATFGTTSSIVTPLNIVTSATSNTGRGITMSIATASFPYARLNVPSGSGGAFSVFVGDGGYESTEQFRVARSSPAAVNYVQVTGAATGAPSQPIISAQGSDANINIALQGKGTGAAVLLDSGGGGTLRAIPRATGGDTFLDVRRDIGGVSLLASSSVTNGSVNLISKGTGAIDLAAGSSGVNISNGGTVTAITRTNNGTGYTSAPTVAITAPTTAGGVQATATATVSAGSLTGITITNAGSGYVEQPTVTFSGGGGSGAAAYATVGSIARLTSIGGGFELATPNGVGFRVANSGTTNVNYLSAQGNAAGGPVNLIATGTDTDITTSISSKGTGSVRFLTNGASQEQLRVSHTASAVNYVQVTGAATGNNPNVTAQGSDNNISIYLSSKGTGSVRFFTNGAGSEQFRVLHTAGTIANYLTATGNTTGNAPSFSVAGSDTNIDLALTPKGTGRVKFGTYTANMALTIQGYIEILDSGGTIRKLAVIA